MPSKAPNSPKAASKAMQTLYPRSARHAWRQEPVAAQVASGTIDISAATPASNRSH